MNEFLERQRLIEEQRRISISNQDMRLKQGDIKFYFFMQNKWISFSIL